VVLVEEEEIELKIKLPDGREVTGKKVNFETIKEEWNEYKLEDGTRLYVKIVISDMIRRNEISPLGEPVYQFSSQNIIKAKVSKRALEEVKRALQREEGMEVT
jgi:hypothetical protein